VKGKAPDRRGRSVMEERDGKRRKEHHVPFLHEGGERNVVLTSLPGSWKRKKRPFIREMDR